MPTLKEVQENPTIQELTRPDYMNAIIAETGLNFDDEGPEKYSIYRQINDNTWGQCLGIDEEEFDQLRRDKLITLGAYSEIQDEHYIFALGNKLKAYHIVK